MKRKVVYPSFRLCVTTSTKPKLTGNENQIFAIFVSFLTQQGFIS